MLTESELLLIASALDADQTPEQVAAVRRLFTEKPEAARLFRRLRADSKRVRSLTPQSAPSNLRAGVMARIAALPTASPASARKSFRRPNWVPYSVAASVLVAVSVGSFVLFAPKTSTTDDLARKTTPTTEPNHDGTPPTAPEHRTSAKVVPVVEPSTVAVKNDTPTTEVIPAPRIVPATEPKDVFTVGEWINSKPLTAAELRLPTLLNATDFHQADVSARVRKEFGTETAHRVDLFSKNPTAALDQLQAVARAAEVNLFVDALTAERVRRPLGLTYALYLENLTADELTALFAALAQQVNAGPKPETVLGSAHFIPAGSQEAKDVRELVGTDLTIGKAAPKPGTDEPISSGTLPMVTAAIKKSGEKVGLVLTYLPGNARVGAAKSHEVKQFLDKRGDRKPGTVPVLIVIRS